MKLEGDFSFEWVEIFGSKHLVLRSVDDEPLYLRSTEGGYRWIIGYDKSAPGKVRFHPANNASRVLVGV